MFDVGH